MPSGVGAAATYFVMSIDLPAVGQVHPCASGEPYLAVSLTLDPVVLTTLLADLPKPLGQHGQKTGFSVTAVTPELMDAWVRLLRLMNKPEEIAALAPVYEREILYRVLQAPHGWMPTSRAVRNLPTTAYSAAGVPVQYDEAADFQTFRIGLFGLEKLHNIERTVSTLEQALDEVMVNQVLYEKSVRVESPP